MVTNQIDLQIGSELRNVGRSSIYTLLSNKNGFLVQKLIKVVWPEGRSI